MIEALRGFSRQALHAARLAFEHPVSGKPVEALASTPADMKALLGVLADDATQAALSSPASGKRGKGK
jgi:23S rRNA pseudouridine1911/1915/1917 synthase